MKIKTLLRILSLCLILFSCVQTPTKKLQEEQISSPTQQQNELSITFSGDIMAHDVNFKMKDFSVMYENISDILLSDDITFGNLEFPIDDEKDYSTYPHFNVHSEYVRTAINAGFDVFSLANNHSNDQGLKSVLSTIDAMEKIQATYKEAEQAREIYFSGLQRSLFDGFNPVIFNHKGIKIAFLSITEILNNYDSSKNKVNLVNYNKDETAEFTDRIRLIKKSIDADLFIVSIHIAEPEYVRTIADTRKEYFHTLADAGIDIIYAQHPHVAQPWELFTRTDGSSSLIMYSMGNFVSGQRFRPAISKPENALQYTGDSFLLNVKLTQTPNGFSYDLNPIMITTWVDPQTNDTQVHKFTEEFIDSLDDSWKPYYKKRLELMNSQFKECLTEKSN